MQIIKADNGGFIAEDDTIPGANRIVAAVSTVKELCAFIEGYYGTVNDGWVEWSGGVAPVQRETQVRVRFADGMEREDHAGLFFGWEHSGGLVDEYPDKRIVAYRVL